MEYTDFKSLTNNIEFELGRITEAIRNQHDIYQSDIGDICDLKLIGSQIEVCFPNESKHAEEYSIRILLFDVPISFSSILGKYLIVEKYEFQPNQDVNGEVFRLSHEEVHQYNTVDIPYREMLDLFDGAKSAITSQRDRFVKALNK